MALLDEIKVFVRQSGDALDAQWNVLIDAAIADMRDKGVDPSLLSVDENSGTIENAQVKHAIALYCQAHGGFIDNNAAARLQQSYLDAVCHLMAHHNVREVREGGGA